MNILVIGNGFDLAHGLKTSYKDFLNYCRTLSMDDNFRQKNVWLNSFLSRQEKIGDKWIDLEKEISKIIGHLFRKHTIPSEIKLGCAYKLTYSYKHELILTDLKKNTHSSINESELIQFLYNQLREFTKAFETYLIKEVCEKVNTQLDCNLYLEPIKEQLPYQNCYILSFNYTDICERLYEQNLGFYQAIIKSVYVHGKINKDEVCNLVLGTHSFDNTYKSNPMSHRIPVYFNVFKKHNQRHRYGTIEAYQDLLNNLKLPSETRPVFYVIGHSLDKTDHNILKHIFLANKNAVINIYYHDEEAQERLINNITDIIGEEEVMSKVRLIYQHDEKRGLLRKTKSLVQSAS